MRETYPSETFKINTTNKESGKLVRISTLEEKPRSLTINMYGTGTIMIQGENLLLEDFGYHKFEAWKTIVLNKTNNTQITPTKEFPIVPNSPLTLTTPMPNTRIIHQETPQKRNNGNNIVSRNIDQRIMNLEEEIIKSNTKQREFMESIAELVNGTISKAIISTISP